MNVTALGADQVENMLHCIGYSVRRIKRGTYTAYRNRFITNGPRDEWDRLVKDGYAKVKPFSGGTSPSARLYSVTRKGLDFLESCTGVKIVEED